MPGNFPSLDLTPLVRRLTAGSGRGTARGILRIWQWWEGLASALWPALPVPGSRHHLVRLRVATYHGPPVTLPDGVSVQSGDTVGEVHVNNRVLVEITDRNRWDILPTFREDLRLIAEWVQQPGPQSAIRALHGYTVLTRAAIMLGLEPVSRPSSWRDRLEQIYLVGLLQIYSQEGTRRVAHGTTRRELPADVWMSRESLLRRYGRDDFEERERRTLH